MNRGTLTTLVRSYLGTASDDPAYTATILNPLLQSAYDSLIADIQDANPHYLSTAVTLTADSSTSHLYTFATQSPAITDFAKWLEVRWTDEDGVLLAEARLEDLRDGGGGLFALTGPDEAPVLRTGADDEAGTALYFRYAYWPADWDEDSDEPTGIPAKYHDLVALEALFAFALGGEARVPADLRIRWMDRRAQLLSRVGRRGIQPSRSRIVERD